jgi:hypothetical protein
LEDFERAPTCSVRIWRILPLTKPSRVAASVKGCSTPVNFVVPPVQRDVGLKALAEGE